MRTKTLIIVISGTMTSGKGAVQYFLSSKGFKSIRFTRPVLHEGLKRQLNMTEKKNWEKITIEMRKKHGKDILARMASKLIKPGERYVICPVRYSVDIQYLKEKYNPIVIFVDAPFEKRYRRTFLKDPSINLSLDDFKKIDQNEKYPKDPDREYKSNIEECRKLKDVEINNDGTLNDLNAKLETILRKYNISEVKDDGVYEDFEM